MIFLSFFLGFVAFPATMWLFFEWVATKDEDIKQAMDNLKKTIRNTFYED